MKKVELLKKSYEELIGLKNFSEADPSHYASWKTEYINVFDNHFKTRIKNLSFIKDDESSYFLSHHYYVDIEEDFAMAKAIVEDSIFELTFDTKNSKDLKEYRLIQARKNNIDFEMELAKIICGDNTNFPYKSGNEISKFFYELGLPSNFTGTRRFWIKDLLSQINTKEIIYILEKGLFKQKYFQEHSKKQNIDYDDFFRNALAEFKRFIDLSVIADEGIDISHILGISLNTELLFESSINTDDDSLNKLIEEAKNRYLTLNDKQVAIEKLWDAFERLKTYFEIDKKQSVSKLIDVAGGNLKDEIESEFKTLTKIGNNYRIRHHEQDKIDIENEKHLEYLFFRMLTLVQLCLSAISNNVKNKEFDISDIL